MDVTPDKSPQAVLLQMLAIILASGLLAGTANLIHSHRIPWVQDWGNYVESKAKDAGIEVIPLSVANSIHQTEDHWFVDARPSAEYSKGHIGDAISLPLENMEDHFQTLEQILESNRPLVIYCRNRECDDALLLSMELRDMGKTNLLYYVDGFELWEESGCPVEAR